MNDLYEISLAYHKINESWYDKNNISNGDTVIFYNNIWHDINGVTINIPKKQEREIINDISKMESLNYSEVPSKIMMDDIVSLNDISDYLGVENEDMFIYFHGTNKSEYSMINKNNIISKTSQTPGLNKSLYLLAGLNSSYDYNLPFNVGVVEIADICGTLSFSEGIKLLRSLMKWMVSSNSKAFFCNCRKETSNRLLSNQHINKIINSFGFYKLNTMNESIEFIPNIYVDIKWYNSLTKEEKESINDVIDYI